MTQTGRKTCQFRSACQRRIGVADTADHNGEVEKINTIENGDYLGSGDHPYWWGWYGWPHWWNYFNGIGRVTWKLQLEPKEK